MTTTEHAIRTLSLLAAAEAVDVYSATLHIRHAGGLERTTLFEGFFCEIMESVADTIATATPQASPTKQQTADLPAAAAAAAAAAASSTDETPEAKYQRWKSQLLQQVERNAPIRTQSMPFNDLVDALKRQRSFVSLDLIESNPQANFVVHVVKSFAGNDFVHLCFDSNRSTAEQQLFGHCEDCCFTDTTNLGGLKPEDVIIDRIESHERKLIQSESDSPLTPASTTPSTVTPAVTPQIKPIGPRPSLKSQQEAFTHASVILSLKSVHKRLGALTLVDRSFSRARARGALLRTHSIGAINRHYVQQHNGTRTLSETEEVRFQCDLLEGIQEFRRMKPKFQLLLIAGPSASGKTTFANRLKNALESCGYQCAALSGDDYYRPASDPDYPKLADGKHNHETVEALRIDFFQQQVAAIFRGEVVETPIFNMKTEHPEPDRFRPIQLDPHRGVLIVEGLFCLQPALTAQIDESKKIRLFVAPLPQFSLSELSIVSNQLVRVCRRISRDYLFRGRGAAQTIQRLEHVIIGEQNTVLPSIKYADIVFNTTHDHECHIIAPFALPLLARVTPRDEPSIFATASRLLQFLNNVLPASDRFVPDYSLLREFIGGSCFDDDGAPAKDGDKDDDNEDADFASEEDQQQQGSSETDVATEIQQLLDNVAENLVAPTTVTFSRLLNDQLQQQEQGSESPSGDSSSYLGTKPSTPADAKPIGVVNNLTGELFSLAEPVNFICYNNPNQQACQTMKVSLASSSYSSFSSSSQPNHQPALSPVWANGTFGEQMIASTSVFALAVAVHQHGKKKAVPAETTDKRAWSAIALHGLGHGRRAARWILQIAKCGESVALSDEDITGIQTEFNAVRASNAPIHIVSVLTRLAQKMLLHCGQTMCARLLDNSPHSHVRLAICNGFATLLIEPLAPSCAHVSQLVIKRWDAVPTSSSSSSSSLASGTKKKRSLIMAAVPEWASRDVSRSERIFDETVREERENVQRATHVECLGDLNRMALNPDSVAAAKRVFNYLSLDSWMNIVRMVQKEGKKVVFLTGPVQAGKSRMSRMLSIAFASCGIRASIIATAEVDDASDLVDTIEQERGPHEVLIVDVDALSPMPEEAARLSFERAIKVYVCPLALFNITELLPISASDIRRVRRLAPIKMSPTVSSPRGKAGAERPARNGQNGDDGAADGGSAQGADAIRLMFRRSSFVVANQDPFLEADIVINTSDIFELTSSRHAVVQRLRLVRQQAHTSQFERVSISRVTRILDFFLGKD